MSVKALRVAKIERVSVKGFAELTIDASCLDPSPNLDVLKVQIEALDEMEAVLRDYIEGEDNSSRTCCAVMIDSPGDHDDFCVYGRAQAILDRIDKAKKV